MITPESILIAKYPFELVNALLQAYKEIEGNYALRRWKASELDAGHFVEAVRRVLELELMGKYTPIGNQLPNFSDSVMKAYEQSTNGDETFRILIPRALKSIYNIRNKRGVGHIAGVSPNEMDSTYILYSVKWVLAELLRLASGFAPEKTQQLVDQIIERRVELIWKVGDITRILNNNLKIREQILILLYDESPRLDGDLQRIIEYANVTNFRKILKRLHSERIIEYRANGICMITPKGIPIAESIINRANV